MYRRDLLFAFAGAALWTIAGAPISAASAQSASHNARTQRALDRALIMAIRNHSVQAVRDLLSKGADANARDLDARPDRRGTVQPAPAHEKPAALLIVFDDAQITTGKREAGAPQYKRRPDPVEIVKSLLEKGADPNVVDYDQTFPLFEAVKSKYVLSVRLLLQHRADPNQTWVHGITPLHRAVSNKDIGTVKLLLAAGANRDARSAFDNPAHPLSEEVAQLLGSAPNIPRDRSSR